MGGRAAALRAFLAAERAAVFVSVTEARGSTPRDAGAWMLVAPDRIFGTIGGGQLEYMAIDEGRRMLAGGYYPDPPQHPPSVSLRSIPPPRRAGWRMAGADIGAYPSSPRSGGEASRAKPETEGGPIKAAGRLGDEDFPPHKGEGKTLSIPLGPEIGQCCGGRVELELTLADNELRTDLLTRVSAEERALPHVYLFGGGHVGHALAAALALLPVRTIVVESREDTLADLPAGVETRLTPVPEALVRDAPAGSAFVILTHDHALDFLIAAEALRRPDAAYVGMIGSATKKATFRSWARTNAPDADPDRLVTPIGGDSVRDKRPAIIAALAAAEIMTALLRQ